MLAEVAGDPPSISGSSVGPNRGRVRTPTLLRGSDELVGLRSDASAPLLRLGQRGLEMPQRILERRAGAEVGDDALTHLTGGPRRDSTSSW